MSLTTNANVNAWVEEMIALCKPEKVVWVNRSEEQLDQHREEVTSLPDGDPNKTYALNQEERHGWL